MNTGIFGDKIKEYIIIGQIVKEVGEPLGLDFHIRCDTSCSLYGTTVTSVVFLFWRDNSFCAICLVRIVYLLHATTRRGVILLCGDLKRSVVGKIADRLYESLTIGTLSYDDATVEILYRYSYNL